MNNLIQWEPNPTWKLICEECHNGYILPDCEYYGEPNGCNSPIYGEHPKPVEPVSNVAAMREVVLMLANVILPQQAEYPAEYGGGKVPDKDGWLAWVRAMQIKARAVLDMQHAQNHATRHAEAVAAGNCRDCVLRGGIAATMREALGKLRAGLWNSSVIAGKRRLELYEIADAAIASAARQSPFKESGVAK